MFSLSRCLTTISSQGIKFKRYHSQTTLRSTLLNLQKNRETCFEKERSLESVSKVWQRVHNVEYSLPDLCVDSLKKGFEVVEEVSSTHYFFWHGASRKELCLRILFAELFFRDQDRLALENEILMRHPLLFAHECKTLDWFKKNLTGKRGATDDDHRLELISLDCTLNHEIGESALGKLANPTYLNSAAYANSLKIISSAVMNGVREKFIQDFNSINTSVYSEYFREADFYVICIPKSKFHTLGYISNPFGVHRKVDHEKEAIENYLKDLGPYWKGAPQIRVLAKEVIPYDVEIATLVFPGMPPEEYRHLVSRIKNLVNQYFTPSSLLHPNLHIPINSKNMQI